MAKRAKKRKSTARRKSRPQKTLSDLFHEGLKDIYFTESKIIKTLPKMAKAAQSKELTAAFNKHLRETQGQVKRLDRVFRIFGKPARGKSCEGINGIAEEGAEIMKEFRGMPALDAGLVAAAQAVEHYEISRYGTLRTWAEQLGMPSLRLQSSTWRPSKRKRRKPESERAQRDRSILRSGQP
jgi:ferritin-like metal-binding protein YciE